MRRLSLVELTDLFRATKELALARYRLGTTPPAELVAVAYDHPKKKDAGVDVAYARRVGLAIGRMSWRVPWCATCLVQALAARRWLARHGMDSSLIVGVRKEAPQDLEAHAWLVCGGEVVTGGDISGFQELLSPEVMRLLKN